LDHLLQRNDGPEYGETVQGAAALAKLDWPTLPHVEGDAVFARSLFQDIADWFEIASPLNGRTSDAFYPSRAVRRDTLTLRNM
jgi:hypothetical protein